MIFISFDEQFGYRCLSSGRESAVFGIAPNRHNAFRTLCLLTGTSGSLGCFRIAHILDMICHPCLTGSLYPTVRRQMAPFIHQVAIATHFFLLVIPAAESYFAKRSHQRARTSGFFYLIDTLRLHLFIDGFIDLFQHGGQHVRKKPAQLQSF